MRSTSAHQKRNMRIQIKTQLLLILSFLMLVLLAAGLIYTSLSTYSHNDFYRLLKLRATTAAKTQLEEVTVENDPLDGEDSEYFEHLGGEKDYFIAIVPDIDWAERAEAIDVPVQFFEQLLQTGEAQYHNRELFYQGIVYAAENENYAVVVKAKNYYHSHHFAFLQKVLLATVTIAFGLALLIASFLARSIFRPLRQITGKVNQISSESLHLRLDDVYNNDELSALVNTFNNMLDRIETSFETQNNFISNASHEFRTPLTAIIGEAEVALSKERSSGEYVDTITVMLQEAEKLDKKTQALLFLAQTGFHGKTLAAKVLRIDQLLWEVKETVNKLNPKGLIGFDLSNLPENPANLKVFANEQLLHLAFSNIINNACKYSDNHVVSVGIACTDSKVQVTVIDKGIGIPEGELQFIYDPFFRASNTEPYEGYGIGMPLSRNIIRMHRGEIIVTSEQHKGTDVTVLLPICTSDHSHSQSLVSAD